MSDQTLFDLAKTAVIGFALAAVLTVAFYAAVLKPLGLTCTVGLSLACNVEAQTVQVVRLDCSAPGPCEYERSVIPNPYK